MPPAARTKPRAKPATPGALTLPEALAAVPEPANMRERILYAAVGVLNEEGFTSLTQQRVCERAGIRQSHLTYYFPTRNDLLREAAAYGCETMLGAVTQAIEQGFVTVENLRVTLNVDVTDRRWARLTNALIAASDEDPRIKPWLAAFDEQIRLRLLGDFRRLGLAVDEADIELLHATFIGAVQMDLGESTDASLARAQRVVALALDRLVASVGVTKGIPASSRKKGTKRAAAATNSQKRKT
jgi:AcrR family transcriptional regulator